MVKYSDMANALVLWISFSFVACFPLVSSTTKEYVAAVFEHEAFFIPFPLNYTRHQAFDIMKVNINTYYKQASRAKSMKADIIVFPEDGLYGFVGYTRQTIRPFLETIPQPSTLDKPWIPCKDPHRFNETEILYELSCIAMNISIAVVANMGDEQPCTDHDPNCPPDKHYQFNTDVAFDVDGTLLAKYHKQHLFREDQFDTPSECEHVTFTTGFGVKFGVFTCFDLLFKSPAIDLISHYGIRNVVMPTGWMDGFPILVSVQYQQAWSRATCVNLIASNQHQPLASMYGSGIYSCGEPKAYLFDPLATEDRRLLVATLTDLETAHSTGSTTDEVISDVVPQRDDVTVSFPPTFKAKIMNDIYNAIPLQSDKDMLSICHNQFCCSLDYRMTDWLVENYVLAAFSGLHNVDQYYLEVCVLLKCPNDQKDSCGEIAESARTVFDYFRLSGNFTQKTHVFPELLVSGMKLLEKDALQVSGHAVMTTHGMKDPLISAVLLGRDYSRDKHP